MTARRSNSEIARLIDKAMYDHLAVHIKIDGRDIRCLCRSTREATFLESFLRTYVKGPPPDKEWPMLEVVGIDENSVAATSAGSPQSPGVDLHPVPDLADRLLRKATEPPQQSQEDTPECPPQSEPGG